MLNAVLITAENLPIASPVDSNHSMYSKNALRALLFIPLLATNVLATFLVGYKAWYGRHLCILLDEAYSQ